MTTVATDPAVPDARPAFRVDAVTAGYERTDVLTGLDVELPAGVVSVIVGANGCGKSTLLRTLGRLLAPRSGRVLLDGHDLHRLPTVEVARRVGVLPQGPVAPDGITVRDLVARGRYPHQGWVRRWSAADEEALVGALTVTDTLALADRPVDRLSGGQRQRVWIALTLAQQTQILLLDEPTTYLDIAHQIEILDLLCELNRTQRTTVVAVLHDLNQAARFGDHVIAMKDGRIHARGTAAQVMTADTVREVFGVDAHIGTDPFTGTPVVMPRSRHSARSAGT